MYESLNAVYSGKDIVGNRGGYHNVWLVVLLIFSIWLMLRLMLD